MHHPAAAPSHPAPTDRQAPHRPCGLAASQRGYTSQHGKAPMRQLYLALSDAPRAGDPALDAAADWLDARLRGARQDGDNMEHGVGHAVLPADAAGFAAWQAARHEAIDEQYKQYVAERRAGAPRRMFSGRAHALHYLSAVAPARLTDGAWLYGILARWDDAALRPLIATYLEELGNGVPDKNHVVIFQQLIDAHGCTRWRQLDETHFHSGLTQLALAHHAERFLPELVGYNLGAEHASLDTLVAAYEMNELGVDPYYFTLHATVDNSATGHARLALEALHALTPPAGTGADASADFFARVQAGLRLHQHAPTSTDLLASFDLERELIAVLADKHIAAHGADGSANPAASVEIAGRALGDWLSDPAQVRALLAALEGHGWVVRGGDPTISRLWRLIEADAEVVAQADAQVNAQADTHADERDKGDAKDDAVAPLSGLFSPYELALLADWIATDPRAPHIAPAAAARARRPGTPPAMPPAPPRRVEESAARGIIRHRFPDDEHGWEAIANELTLLEARVVASNSKAEAIALLTALMTPSNHHTSTGLMATRMFSKLFTA